MMGRGHQLVVFSDDNGEYNEFNISISPGSDIEELKVVLEKVFNQVGPVALVDVEDESVISLSIVCSAPDMLLSSRYKVLFETQKRIGMPRVILNQPYDDDDEEDEVEVEWLLQAHLLMAVTYFEDAGEMDGQHVEVLRQLISDGDERTMAAMELFNEDQDWDELRDTLQRIAIIEATEEEDDEEEANEEDYQYDDEDRQLSLEVVVALFKAGYLNKSETLVIKRLIEMDNPLIHAAEEVFEQQGDDDDFADTLRRIAERYGIDRLILSLLEQGYISKEEAGIVAKMFRDANSDVTSLWKSYCDHLNERVLADQILTILICHNKGRFILRMKSRQVFDETEASILTDLLANSDPSFLAIFDVLASDGDLTDALDSLKRLCLARSVGYQQNNIDLRIPSTLGKEGKETLELVHALALDEVLSEVQYRILNSLITKEDERVLAAHETYVINQDIDDFIDTLKQIAILAAPDAMKSNSSEDQTILDIMFQLVYTGKLEAEEAALLGGLVTTQDPRLLAAFDVYQLEQDEEDLADTLQRIALVELKERSEDEMDDFYDDDVEEDDDEGDGQEEDDDDDIDDDDFDDVIQEEGEGEGEGDDSSLDGGETITDDDDYDWVSEEATKKKKKNGANLSI